MADDQKIPIIHVAGGGIGPDLMESYFTYKHGKYKFFDSKNNKEKSPKGGVAKGENFAFHLNGVDGIEWLLTIDKTSTETKVTGHWYEARHRVENGLPVGNDDQTYTAQSSGAEEDNKNAVSATA